MAKRAKTFVPGAGVPAEKKAAAAGGAAAPAGAQPTVNGTAPSGQMQQDIEAIKVSLKCELQYVPSQGEATTEFLV